MQSALSFSKATSLQGFQTKVFCGLIFTAVERQSDFFAKIKTLRSHPKKSAFTDFSSRPEKQV